MSFFHQHSIAYRPEIDGLRAVAVLPVIFFHAGFETFSGGFVGVDIFFVISGYLITSIILREMEQDKFSIAKFYERRARRILPALCFVILCCLPAAWVLMLPDELVRFGQSIQAVTTFCSNIFFWFTTDYFAPAAEEQPLLHTWSLAVEEQYYVLFPLFLMLFWRFGKSRLFWLTLFAAAMSLALAEWGWRNEPVANFYLLPSRAWELLAGSLLAFLPVARANKLRTKSPTADVMAIAGFGLIIYGIFGFDGDTPFPSLVTLVPVLGTVLIIAFAGPQNVVGWLLSCKPFVGVGLISYSAYLWHQPLLSFIRLSSIDAPTRLHFFSAAVLSLLLAWLTWKFVEMPFRASRANRNRIALSAVAVVASVFSVGFVFHYQAGFESRFDFQASSLVKRYENYFRDWQSGECFIHVEFQDKEQFEPHCFGVDDTLRKTILIGDSHAAALYPGLRDSLKDTEIVNLTMSGCMPYITIPATASKWCRKLNPKRFDFLRTQPAATDVIIHAEWRRRDYMPDSDEREHLRQTVQHIQKAFPEGRLVLVGCMPAWNPTLPKHLVRMGYLTESKLPERIYNKDERGRMECNRELKNLARTHRVVFVDAWEKFCTHESQCLVSAPLIRQSMRQELVVFDDAHLTYSGSMFMASAIDAVLHSELE